MLVRGLLIAVRAAVLALLITVGLLVAPLPAQAATMQLTATENVNVRAKPSTSSKIVGGLSRGQTVTGISTSKGWTKIKFGVRAGVRLQQVPEQERHPSEAECGRGGRRQGPDHRQPQPAEGLRASLTT